MDQRKRLFYVLTCLVGAMTSTASLLAWMESPQPKQEIVRTPETALRIARSVVIRDVPVHTAKWQRVEIVPEPSPQTPDIMLTSYPGQNEYHFFIDDRGSLSRASRWRGQLPASSTSDTVRVRLARPSKNAPISAEQTRTLRALLRALDELIAPAEHALPVRLDPAFARDELRAAVALATMSWLTRASG